MTLSSATTKNNGRNSRYAYLTRRAITQARRAKADGQHELARHYIALARQSLDMHLNQIRARQ